MLIKNTKFLKSNILLLSEYHLQHGHFHKVYWITNTFFQKHVTTTPQKCHYMNPPLMMKLRFQKSCQTRAFWHQKTLFLGGAPHVTKLSHHPELNRHSKKLLSSFSWLEFHSFFFSTLRL